MNSREKLKMRLLEDRGYACEVLPYFLHECRDAQDMHEVIYTRNDVRGLASDKKNYINDEHNVVLVCHEFHISDGRTEAYTRACVQALVERFGLEAIRNYIFCAPFKLATPASRLAFWMHDDSIDYE